MRSGYYGAPTAAEQTINDLLGLSVTGREQDWECELADSRRIDELIALYATHDLDIESRSALGLLLLYSMCDADDEGLLTDAQIHAVEQLFSADEPVRERMRFYWFEALKSEPPPFLDRVTRPPIASGGS